MDVPRTNIGVHIRHADGLSCLLRHASALRAKVNRTPWFAYGAFRAWRDVGYSVAVGK
jgi:hypothetical protein